MLFLVYVHAIPHLESLCESVKVILLEAVKLVDTRCASEDLEFVTLSCATPLCAGDLVSVKCECLAAA